MSGLAFTVTGDQLTPSLTRLASPALQARAVLGAATALAALAQRAFDEPALRPSSWAPRKKSRPHPLLILSGDMRQNVHVSPDGDSAEIRFSQPYAKVHQLGSAKRNIPARPFFPATSGGQITAPGLAAIEDVINVLVGDAYRG
jgi:phage gpG-like protein